MARIVSSGGMMGLRGVSIGSLLLVFLVVLLIFGARRLRTIGEDLGNALKGFRRGIRDEDTESPEKE